MTSNQSLALSLAFKQALAMDLSAPFMEDFPKDAVAAFVETYLPGKTREKVYTIPNTLFTMLLSATQEDKSLQQAVNLFKHFYEAQGQNLQQQELKLLEEEKSVAAQNPRPAGRPKLYKSKLPKSKTQELSNSTVAYSNARGRLPYELVKLVFDSSADFGELEQEEWHGLHTYITDGTYLQLQDTEAIREIYPPIENNGMFPQALLQAFIRQGSGQVSQYSIGSRKESELQLVIPMIETLKETDLLLADDLYNTYYHFYLIQKQNAHIIVPGKRDRNYTVIKQISLNDEIVEIKKYRRPDYVSKTEWKQIPKCIRLRRISYNYTTNNGGSKPAVLYTTLTDETISAADIVLKYGTRWDIEITIREIKTLMDINVLRSKSPEMLKKELSIALTAYNLVRKIIARSADKADFSPQKDIFHRCVEISHPILLDKKGRVFYRWSPGRYGKTSKTNPKAAHPN